MTDFFVSAGWIKLGQQVQPMQTKVDIIDPKNVGIHDITDIEYLHRKFTATLRVPRAHLGFEKDVNSKSTLTIQDVQYVRFLRDIQQIVGHGLKQLFDIALVLQDIDPEQTVYEISWPALNAVDQMNAAQSELWRAQAHGIYANAPFDALDGRWVQQHVFNMSDEEMDEVDQRVAEYKAEQIAQMAQQQQQGIPGQTPKPPQGSIQTVGKSPKAGGGGKKLPNPTGFRRTANEKQTQSRVSSHGRGEDDLPPTPNPDGIKSVTTEYSNAALLQAMFETTDSIERDLVRLGDKVSQGSKNGHSNGHNPTS